MKCVNCGEPGACLCWVCVRPVLVYAVAGEIIRGLIGRLLDHVR